MMTEEEWRKIILGYYNDPGSVSKYLASKGITKFRDQFDKRLKGSGLKQLRLQKESCKKAATQYDRWVAEKSKTDSTAKSKPKFTEEEWRSFVLIYYRTEKKSISKFLEEMEITQRDVFNKRWKDSGLKSLKAKGFSSEEAATQYDFWFRQWKTNQSTRQRNNCIGKRTPQPLFQIHEDTEADAGTNEDENNVTAENPPSTENNIDIDDGNSDTDSSDTRSVLGDVSNRKTKKLSNEELSETMAEFYVCEGLKLLTFIKKKDLLGNKKSITRHWKESGLAEMKERSEPLVKAIDHYKDWIVAKQKQRSEANTANAASTKALPAELEVFMTHLIKQLALCGQGLGKKAVSIMFTHALKDWNSSTSGESLFCTRTLDRFIEKYELECRSVKNIDPARIEQVTAENRDAFFFRLDQVVALLHSIDPTNCPWKSWAEVDRRNIDNMDEMGTDGTRFRELMVIPKDVMQRLFQSTPEGDRAHSHISLCVFSKSNGYYKDESAGIEGAPMPLVIHSKASSKDKGASAIEKRMRLYNPDEFVDVPSSYSDGISAENPLGITIRTSNNGSMTKDLFLDAMLHYLKSLGSDQGKHGKYVFLLLDSHVSRWNPIALYELFKNRVIPIFFPSHLSIVVQPQDNGVILFLHKCIEEASMMPQVFETETNAAYVNRILEAAFHLFRDGERKKLLDHGSNSTTRAYRIPGIMPRNPFSPGWRENLELYASFNGLRMRDSNPAPNYGVRPKDKLLCPPFSEEEIFLLNQAVPILARGESVGETSILDNPKSKCYAIANDIVNKWIEKPSDERTVCPRATNVVERIALKHMSITHILSADPKSPDLLLVDENFKESKRKAILTLTMPMETIEARPKGESDEDVWFKVTKMTRPADMWTAFNGEKTMEVSTGELDAEWILNLGFDMFPSDKKLRQKRIRSYRRRRFEKDLVLQRMARNVAEEERDAKLKLEFEEFMNRPKNMQTFAEFKRDIVPAIENPSNHTVSIDFESEEHMIEVCAHGKGTSSMSKLVMDNICKTLVSVSTQSQRKSSRRGGNKVNKTKRGSDGIVKIAQIDEQHQLDCMQQCEDEKKTKAQQIHRCRRRLRELRNFATSPKYQKVWHDDGSLDLLTSHLTKPLMVSLLKVFNVEGRTKLSQGAKEKIKTALEKIGITQHAIEQMEERLLEELRQLGEEDDFMVDQSFGTESSFFSAESSSSNEESEIEIGGMLESEISVAADDTDIEITVDDTILQHSTENLQKKAVSFADSLEIREILPDDGLSSDSVTPKRRTSRRQKNKPPSKASPPPPAKTRASRTKTNKQSPVKAAEQGRTRPRRNRQPPAKFR